MTEIHRPLAPFSLIAERGLPVPPASSTEPKVVPFTWQIRSLIGPNPHYNTLGVRGQIVSMFMKGHHRTLPDDMRLIEPVPPHGVTFHDPEFLANYPVDETTRGSKSLVRLALRDLVIAAATPISNIELEQ